MKKNRRAKEKISIEIVKHVAELARLNLTDKEIKKFQKELNEILLAFKDLDDARANCKPSFQPIEMKNVVREDEVEESWNQEKALSQTKHKQDGFFKGPRAILD